MKKRNAYQAVRSAAQIAEKLQVVWMGDKISSQDICDLAALVRDQEKHIIELQRRVAALEGSTYPQKHKS